MYEIAGYLLFHKEGIEQDLDKSYKVPWSFVEDKQEAIIDRVIRIVAEGLSLSYEGVASVIDRAFIERVLGEDWLSKWN